MSGTVMPIKDPKKIQVMKMVLAGLDPDPCRKVRNVLLFVMGINTALRISDLLNLKVGSVVDADGNFRNAVSIYEEKTGKFKRFPLNDSVRQVLNDYPALQNGLETPLFPSRRGEEPITRVQAWRLLNRAAELAGLEAIGTHTLRKTFGYHTYKRTGNLGLVQKLLNHSSSGDTLRYIGVDQETMDEAYLALNL